MQYKILSCAHHRNGIDGDPFDVALFKDDDGSTKLAVDFGGEAFAVLQVDKMAKGDISFGSNSWRGYQYAPKLRPLMAESELAVSNGALCVVWSKRRDG